MHPSNHVAGMLGSLRHLDGVPCNAEYTEHGWLSLLKFQLVRSLHFLFMVRLPGRIELYHVQLALEKHVCLLGKNNWQKLQKQGGVHSMQQSWSAFSGYNSFWYVFTIPIYIWQHVICLLLLPVFSSYSSSLLPGESLKIDYFCTLLCFTSQAPILPFQYQISIYQLQPGGPNFFKLHAVLPHLHLPLWLTYKTN